MGTGKDKKQRTRRKKTDKEKQETLRKKKTERQKSDQETYGSVASFFSTRQEVPAAGGADVNVNEGDAAELIRQDSTANNDVAELDDAEPEEADEIIIFTEDIDAGVDVDPMIVANLDVDDQDYCDVLDEAAEAEPEVVEPTKLKRGVQQDYMRAINDRLWVEVKDKTKAFEKQWLIEHLKNNDGWVRKEQAKSIIQMLTSKKQSPSTYKDATASWRSQNKLYYRDIKVWLPDILMLGGFSITTHSFSSIVLNEKFLLHPISTGV